jgi:hypothetical protein
MEKRDHVVFYSFQKKSHMFGTGFIVNKKRKHLILDLDQLLENIAYITTQMIMG